MTAAKTMAPAMVFILPAPHNIGSCASGVTGIILLGKFQLNSCSFFMFIKQ